MLGVAAFGSPVWGAFDSGNNVIFQADSFVSLEYRREWAVSDFPVENGGFSAYNKVVKPFLAKVTFATASSQPKRAAMLAALETAAASTNLYSIVTPDATYSNSANIQAFRYSRKADKGAGMILVEIDFIEIRQVAVLTFSNVASPNAAGQVNSGNVSPGTPTAAQMQEWLNAVPPIQFSS